jgi:predicted nucleic acid-binding protein
MRPVVADTSPIRYLIQIAQLDLLPRLFEKILMPSVVADELCHPSAPPAVRDWMQWRMGEWPD